MRATVTRRGISADRGQANIHHKGNPKTILPPFLSLPHPTPSKSAGKNYFDQVFTEKTISESNTKKGQNCAFQVTTETVRSDSDKNNGGVSAIPLLHPSQQLLVHLSAMGRGASSWMLTPLLLTAVPSSQTFPIVPGTECL